MNYVIIGNSTAAVGCIEQIRKTDRKGKITVISDEPYHTYGRPLISYYLLGRVDAAHMGYRPADFYEKNGVKTLLGVRAEKIDPAAKKVLLQGGKSVSYDKLLVATGSRPFVPPMEGYDTVKEKFTFMTFADALALEQALSPEKDVLIVGAGLTGLKCMEGILARVKSVTVVDLADRLMPSALDEYGAGIIQRQLEGMGVKFYLKNAVARFDGNTAHLKGGETLPFDILVVAAGVRPNVELVKDAGGEVARGIVTDDRQRTSLPDVYAAGDCTESYDITSGTRKILAPLPNAYFQGACAGANMAGAAETFDIAVPLNAVGFFGSHVLTAGTFDGEAYEEKGGDTYKKLFFKDGVLNGFILVNEPDRAGIYTSLVRNRTPLAEVDAELLKKHPALMAFSAAVRREKLAKKV